MYINLQNLHTCIADKEITPIEILLQFNTGKLLKADKMSHCTSLYFNNHVYVHLTIA